MTENAGDMQSATRMRYSGYPDAHMLLTRHHMSHVHMNLRICLCEL